MSVRIPGLFAKAPDKVGSVKVVYLGTHLIPKAQKTCSAFLRVQSHAYVGVYQLGGDAVVCIPCQDFSRKSLFALKNMQRKKKIIKACSLCSPLAA